jgi:hypothetical protein
MFPSIRAQPFHSHDIEHAAMPFKFNADSYLKFENITNIL